MENYTDSRYWALSGMGWGRGFTPEEAIENYVATQLQNFAAEQTIFKTTENFEAALRGQGSEKSLRPNLWKAPPGVSGFQ